MYLIEELWIDTLENRDSHGYEAVGYVDTLEEAEIISNNYWVMKSQYPYPLNYVLRKDQDKIAKYRFKEIPKFIVMANGVKV